MTGYSEHRREQPSGAAVAKGDVPPSPPTVRRRLALTRKQKLGLPVIIAIPILTLLGVFGEHRGETHATSRSIGVEIRYPDRFRYRQVESLDIMVWNRTGSEIDTIQVWIDTAYVTRFSSVRIEPEPIGAFSIDLLHVKPGESRLVTAELWGERYGRHRGQIIVSTHRDTATAVISTFVFP
jgi:hypothetical protein